MQSNQSTAQRFKQWEMVPNIFARWSTRHLPKAIRREPLKSEAAGRRLCDRPAEEELRAMYPEPGGRL